MAVLSTLLSSIPPLSLGPDRSPRAIITRLTSSYVQHRKPISRALFASFVIALVVRTRHAIAEQKAASARHKAARTAAAAVVVANSDGSPAVAGPKRKKVELDMHFFRALLKLLKIVVPSWRSAEARLLLSHTFFLIVRTLLSLRVAAMDGAIVKSLIKGNGREFLKRIVWWMVIAVPATFTNSMVSITYRNVLYLTPV